VTIWTDVEGVFNADPNKIADARLLSSMSLAEADRLARLGSPVLHCRTLQPLFDTEVSLAVRSSYASHTDFTLIAPKSDAASAPVVTNLNQVSLLSLEFNGTQAQTQTLDARNEVGLTPLAYWSQGQHKLELAYTPELSRQVWQLLEAQTSELKIQSITEDRELGLVALVSSGAGSYRRSFARLLSREPRR
ncbi:amino acid kinase family protein, partial [Vibrio cholerae]|uniref:amino acid kinase family protein n=1 Tax=Vibrio cholerae TaxID=666 RepID=UPI003F5D3F4E